MLSYLCINARCQIQRKKRGATQQFAAISSFSKSICLPRVSKVGSRKIISRAGSEGVMDESGAIATGFRSEIDRSDLIDSILPRPFQSFVRKTTIASLSFRGVVHRLFRRAIIFGPSFDRRQGEDGKRADGGEEGEGAGDDIRANLRKPIFCATCTRNRQTHMRRLNKTAPLSGDRLSFSLFMYKSTRENT